MRARRALAAGLAGALALGGLALGLDAAFPPDLGRARTVGAEVLDRNGRTVALFPVEGGTWRLAARAEDVSAHYLDLLLRTEDRRFFSHPGVDPLALLRAAWQWARAGHVVSGGSTLTMQVARMLERRPRTLASKAIEIFRAFQLEARFSKREILGLYLTLAPYGGNLEGIRAGALAWFGRPPARLDPDEAALLVALPRSPERLRPDRHPERARAARDALLGVPAAQDVPHARAALPRHAPQPAAALARAAPGARIATTLDLPLQQALERLGDDLVLPDRARAALLVVDIASREIRAIVGATGGSLDLTRAVRSPGSALKPFVYALAFADGLATPDAPLPDLPRRFGAYAPENYDRGFAGNVTAAEALRRSLNVPAVALLDRLGPLRFASALKAAGVTPRLAPGAEPSLPLALGGAGVTLRELATLYAALADGRAAPLLLEGPAPARPFLDPHAARLVRRVLTRRLPGTLREGIAWKTGTSWGGRDAWAVGLDQRHVVAVWVGRADGTAMPGATGLSTAIPVLARVFDLLEPAPLPRPPAPATAAAPVDGLRLLFPPSGAVLAEAAPVTLRAMGGRRPLTFMVDGIALAGLPARRDAGWAPPGPGFYRVTVMDVDGAAASAVVRVRP